MIENERFKIIRKELGFNQEELANAINIKQGSISDIERGKVNVSDNIKYKLNKILNVNIEYIEKGLEPKLFEAKNISQPESVYHIKSKNCIFVPLKAVGGFLAGYENKVYLDSLERFEFNQIKGECYCFEVEGSSMCLSKVINGEIFETGYKPGSFVVATRVENFDWLSKNKEYVFQTTDGLIIKRFEKIKDEKFILISINDDYNPVPPIPLKAVKGIYFIEKKIS
jgi:transcriptional regulator with XRE-family HTH domain